MIGSRKALVLVGLALVAGTAMAGCLEDGSGGADTRSAAGDSSEGAGDDVDEASVRETVQESMPMATEEDEGNGTDGPDRFSVEGTFENETDSVHIEILLHEPRQLMVFATDLDSVSSQYRGTTASEEGTFLLGKHGKATVFGVANESGTEMVAWYNESADPVDELGDDTSSDGGPTLFEGADPTAIMENVSAQLDADEAQWSVSRTRHGDRPAVEAHIRTEDEGVTYNVTAIVLPREEMMVRLEGTVEADDPSALGEGMAEGRFSFAFDYGDDVSSPHEREVVRGASLAFKTEDEVSAFGTGAQNRTVNRTIQPTPADGVVALEEAELLVRRSGLSSSGDPALRMPLEEGTASNEEVSVTFDDADGDGLVSPGDGLTLTALGDATASSYTMSILDEETDVKVTPGAPALGLLAAVAASALLAGRGRR